MAIIDIAISLAKYAACIYFPYLLLLCAVMRHGPNKLIFNSAQALRDIYHNERVTKSDVYLRTVAAGTPSVLSTLDKQAHRTRRKVIAQAINDKAAHAFALTMIAQVDIFVDQLSVSSRDGRPVDMTDRCKRLGMVIVGLLAFGYLLHMQTDETNRFMLRGLSIGTWQNNSFMQFPLLKKLGMHHLLLLHGYYQRRMYKRTLQTMIRRRLSEEKHAQNDLYSFVADRLDNASDGMTTTDLWAEALFFIPAGPCPKRAWLGPVPRRRTCDTARDRGGRLHVFPSPPRRLLSGPVCFSTGALARRRRRYASTNAFGLLPLFRGRSGVRGKTHGLLRSEPRVCQDALALRFRGGPREGRRGRRGCFGADGRTRKGRTSLSCTTPLVPSTKGPTCYFMIVPDPVAILS